MKKIINHSANKVTKKELSELSISDMLMIRGGGKIDDDAKGNE